jgi:hypothetical protein
MSEKDAHIQIAKERQAFSVPITWIFVWLVHAGGKNYVKNFWLLLYMSITSSEN